ncbi:MAG: M20 family metallopeptidase [Deltaproteobacteria bacterium]|nr:M20 family metallopeptidase [Deltaproteobacteria bacterium]
MFDFLETARDFIAIDSVSRTGTREAVDFLAPLMESVGLEPVVQVPDSDSPEQVNLIGLSHRKENDPYLLISTHLDTVDPGDLQLWTKTGQNPFAMHIEGDALYGLGTADTKLAILCQLEAVSRIDFGKLKKPFGIAGTFGEEIGLLGARAFMRTRKWVPRYVIVNEPSELEIVYTHKGHLVIEWKVDCPSLFERADSKAGFFEALFSGRAVHSATPHLGINPISLCLEWVFKNDRIGQLVSLNSGSIANRVPSSATAVIASSASAEELAKETGAQCREAGEWTNKKVIGREVAEILRKMYNYINQLSEERQKNTAAVTVARIQSPEEVPGCLVFTISFRFLPGVDTDRVLLGFEECSEEIEAKWPDAKVDVRIERRDPAFYTDQASALVVKSQEIIKRLGYSGALLAKPACTEASIYAAHGCEVIVVGPGVSTGNAHCPNEHNSLKQLRSAVEYYQEIISALCSS